MLPVCMMQRCNTPQLLSCVYISKRLKTELVKSLYLNYFLHHVSVNWGMSDRFLESFHKKRFIFINITTR